MNEITLDNGKYTIVNDVENTGDFYALRYGEEWRDLIGDKLVLALVSEIEDLREELSKAHTKLSLR
jgi:hypothetical protein